ncbi:methyl-accepting chemotaxis sensory transducer with Cache sensor [Dongia mobilis]|uniref:Methyl-accepting chemotaxis sensory transducer with Cache sensor n=1 Tax=Dongia mobilis TaxID=578943 RepID=A0A4R6WMS7_9PROT|nr:methyl-accepting chemotaxis protein [Dongia mobilis]TDQ82329.1 methyl-accepting chemotaxis sensory transducer with Cache sensor [Dongia mobilis]
MNLWNRLSLAGKLLLPICLALIIGLGVSTYIVRDRSAFETQTLSINLGRATAEAAAAKVQLRFNTAFEVARVLAENTLAAKEANKPRQDLIDATKAATRANPDLVGTWIEIIADGYDNKAEEYKGTTGMTAGGRISIYTVHKDGDVDVAPPSEGENEAINQDYFKGAFDSGQEYISVPYVYPVNGVDVLMTSVTVPIIEDGKPIGVAGVDLALDSLGEQLAKEMPLGDGQVFLASADGSWVANSDPDFVGKTIKDTRPDLLQHVEKAVGGEALELTEFSDALQVDVLRILSPVALGEAPRPWVVMTNLRMPTVNRPTDAITQIVLISSGVLVVALTLVMILLVRSLAAKPVQRLTTTVEQLAGGNTNVEVPGTARGDELGVMAKAIEIFRQKLIEIEALRQQTQAAEAEAAAARRRGMLELADSFEASVKGVVQAVSSSAVELEANAQSMSSVAEEATKQAQAVAAATTEASTSVTTVAAASEELSASIGEISRQVSDSARTANDAVGEVDKTGETMSELAAAAEEIGGIVRLIGEIASQTNLLALNATIEAARAGDMGKGFAVVASEVKNLANQTAKATEEITGRIQKIQTTTNAAVEAMGTVKATIAKVSEISSAIAAAVEEQTAATAEISSNATQAASGTEEVARSIEGVSRAADDAGSAAGQVLEASGELAKQAEALRHEVDSFIARVRAG